MRIFFNLCNVSWRLKTETLLGLKLRTVECWNLNVRNPNNAKIQTFLCWVSRRSDFRHLGCAVFSIVRFDLFCIESNKNCSVLYHSPDFRQKKTSEIQTCSDFGQRPHVRKQFGLNALKRPKSEQIVRISDKNFCLKAERSAVRTFGFRTDH